MPGLPVILIGEAPGRGPCPKWIPRKCSEPPRTWYIFCHTYFMLSTTILESRHQHAEAGGFIYCVLLLFLEGFHIWEWDSSCRSCRNFLNFYNYILVCIPHWFELILEQDVEVLKQESPLSTFDDVFGEISQLKSADLLGPPKKLGYMISIGDWRDSQVVLWKMPKKETWFIGFSAVIP